jgi:GNAT superfamily N-acetyltransferase
MTPEPSIRRELRNGDLETIVAHHGRLYSEEYGVDADFERMVASAVARAAAHGFPGEREAVWLVELDGEHAGSLALTEEGDREAAIRWFVLDPEARGHGLGRRLLDELLATASGLGYERIGSRPSAT